MSSIGRRGFVQGVLAFPFLGSALARADGEDSPKTPIRVRRDEDRFGKRRKVFGSLPIDVKVAASDTGGRLLLIEQVDDVQGGPPRHVHPHQEEWFFVVEGEYVIVVGDDRYDLRPGDSVLAPRGIPHTWAHVGEGHGRMLIGFQPAGRMESFFEAATQLDEIPSGSALTDLFRSHDMELVGPPLNPR